jgi:hypothetical protein
MILCRMKTQLLFIIILVTYISFFSLGLMKLFGHHLLNESKISGMSSMQYTDDDDKVDVEVDGCWDNQGRSSNSNTWDENDYDIHAPMHHQLQFLHIPKNGGSAITDSAIKSNVVSCINIQYSIL